MNHRHAARTWGPWAPLLLLLTCSAVAAHEGHKKKPSPSPAASASPAAVTGESAAASPEPDGEESASAAAAKEEAPPPDSPPADDIPNPLSPFPWKSIFTEHLHNKIIHFPFALGIASALLLLAGRRWPAYEPAARVLLLGAGLAAIAAFFTGRLQQEAFEDGALEPVLKIHRLLGLSTAGTLWLGVLLTSRAGWRGVWPFYAVLLLGLLMATATFGGLLSHGQF
jgi:uncharacterized membrane protein